MEHDRARASCQTQTGWRGCLEREGVSIVKSVKEAISVLICVDKECQNQ